MDQREQILEALDTVWRTQGAQFATFESAEDEDVFIQYMDGVLHVDWPHIGDPDDVLDEADFSLPESSFVLRCDPGHSLQIAAGDLDVEDVADLVEDLFECLLAPGDEVVAHVEAGR